MFVGIVSGTIIIIASNKSKNNNQNRQIHGFNIHLKSIRCSSYVVVNVVVVGCFVWLVALKREYVLHVIFYILHTYLYSSDSPDLMPKQ